MGNMYVLTSNGGFINQNELYHYGIKGMKWGVRRYQNADGTLTAAGKKRYDDSDNLSESNNKDKKRGLTDKQKKAIKIGAAIVGTALVAYGGYKLSQLYRGVGAEIDPETGFRLIKKNSTDQELLHAINPGRIKFLSKTKNVEIINGSSTNCMLCTTAYEFRKRGYDVRAGLEKNGTGFLPDNLFPKIFKNYKGVTNISYDGTTKNLLDNIETFAKSQGPGSRGNVMCWWKQGGGHSMIWENVNGKIVFKDGQTDAVYEDFANQILKHARGVNPVQMLRTDNLVINASEAKKFLNTDTLVKTYVDHGAEIAVKAADTPVGKLGMLTAAWVAYRKVDKNLAVINYKNQHPNTVLSDKEIAKMLSKQY